MESGEVIWPSGRSFNVNCIKNLNGHLIQRNRIHADKMMPTWNVGGDEIMYEGEQWAIETFGSYGLIASKIWAIFLSFFGPFGPIGPFGP